MSKQITLITVGKLKETEIKKLEAEFTKRFKLFSFDVIEAKSFSENLEKESLEVKKHITDIRKKSLKTFVALLMEKGKMFDSQQFAKNLGERLEQFDHLIFIIGGASGHGEHILNEAQERFSLSLMTFPHQLARLLFIEQLYRAQTILAGHPYHK